MDRIKPVGTGELSHNFKDKIDELVKKEFANLKKEHVHPEVQDIIAKSKGYGRSIEGLPKELYDVYVKQCNNEKKRPSDDGDTNDALFFREYKIKYPRIDTSRYVPHESAETSLLGITDSYLKHQELVLSTLLPRTISNQWTINNDQIQQTSKIVEEMNSQQRKQIRDLEVYRERLQWRYEPTFLQDRP